MDFKGIEAKWRKRWEEAGVFEANVDKREKVYLTVAYPYPSGAMHVGHGRTYTVPDVIARFKRMRGYNVLFPMAWHVTGTPVLGIAERIKRGDKHALWLYGDLYRVPKEKLKRFVEPEPIVEHFSSEYRELMRRLGYSIDWRRQFMTKDRQYNRFIEWQYRKLKAAGLITKGRHPVKYCPNDDNPVGDHDLLAGDTAEINEFTLLKFKYEDLVLPCATLRPETVFGTTNIWLDPEARYVKAKVDGETWVLSREAGEKLKHQAKKVEVVGELKGEELIGKKVVAPLTGKEVPVLPASFLDPDYGTGVVFSVPAHAPFDYMALLDLKKAGHKAAAGIEPIAMIDVAGYESVPAKELCEKMGIKDQNDERLEEATEKLYKEEHAKGRVKKETPEFGGLPVSVARVRVRERMLEERSGDTMYDFSLRPVTCRCGTGCIVKILEDQWFLRYSDEEWKEKARGAMEAMAIVPPELRANFLHYVNWLHDWACSRRSGLGTHMPWDTMWMIEPLSDSTIYMAYYTISRYIKELDPDRLNDAVFDHLFLGKGDAKAIAKGTGIEPAVLKAMREEFEYWYAPDWRFSAKDLIGNHLTFHVFHHTAIFPREKWPKGIVVFGIGLLDGNKMSSSKGNVVLLEDALDENGSDCVRLFLMGSAEPWQDFDWRAPLVSATGRQIAKFRALCSELISSKGGTGRRDTMDRWVLSRLQKTVAETTGALENFQTREAIQSSFYLFMKDLLWYLKNAEESGKKLDPKMLLGIVDTWVRTLAPFIPYTCEEVWEEMGKKGFVAQAAWPKVEKKEIDEEAEAGIALVRKTAEDIANIVGVTRLTPKKVHLYTAPAWKWEVFRIASNIGKPDVAAIMGEAMKSAELKKRGKEVSSYLKTLVKDITKERFVVRLDEAKVLEEAEAMLAREFNCEVFIHPAEKEAYDPQDKRRHAAPLKPAIFIE